MLRMSRLLPPTAAALALSALAGCSDEATSPTVAEHASPALGVASTGNGGPSGAH
jgi:curli biogenesis system outer membrane secretion channel CsgG